MLGENTPDEDTQRAAVGNFLYKLADNSKFFPYGLTGLQKLYFKEVHVWTQKEFVSNFVKRYCAS
jgi:hypothetical protein